MTSRLLQKIWRKNFYAYLLNAVLIGLVTIGCASTKKMEDKPLVVMDTTTIRTQSSHGVTATNGYDFGFDDHEYISLRPPILPNPKDSLTEIDVSAAAAEIASTDSLDYQSPVANKIVENYLNSENKEPDGHCLAVSKGRFEQAYKEVHGHLPYKDFPDDMASKYNTARQVFNLLYASASEKHQRWRSLPKNYRGKGNAGAIAYAGMGTLVGASEIWSGQLKPGALVQVWRYKEDYEQVVRGANVKKLDPYGHSFIFISYVRDEKNNITGLKIADQGFQSYRPLIPRDYEVWWGVNLSI